MSDRLDLLLTHAYFLATDPREQELMRPFPPLGMQYLVAWLHRAGWGAVDWLDSTFLSGPEAVLARIQQADPRAVGFYGHTITRPVAAGMIAQCRAEGRRVIAGGPDPVQYLDEYFAAGVEVVVIGEGEQTLTALLSHLTASGWQWDHEALRKIDGIAFMVDGRIVRTAPRALIRPLDTIPWPDRRPAELSRYFDAWRTRHRETALSMVTSRGCPYHCTWCSKQVYGDTFRRRSVGDVIDELLYLKETFAPDQIWFADDLFTINRTRVQPFCVEMIRRDAVTPFYIIGRPETLTPQMCTALAAAGCYRMYLSAESGAQHVLDAMRKEDTVADILRAGRMLRAAGIEIGVFVMIGYPGERVEDIDATLRMLHTLEPEVTLLSVAHPMKGTQFYDAVADRVTEPPGWAERNGGRLAFEMDYPREFYDMAQRMIWAETGLVRKLRRGEYDTQLARLLVKTPALRLASRAMAHPLAGRWLQGAGGNTVG